MITVRAMQVKDAQQVSELERTIFSQPWSYQGFVDSLNLPNTVFLVAEENNKILGYIGMYCSNDSAIRLYERNGFVNHGVRKGFYELPKEDAYIMIYGQ